VRTQQTGLKTNAYEDVLGKSINDKAVIEFLASTPCSPADQFLLCKAVGMALWMDSNQIVAAVYLYLNNKDGFEPYQGELPFGLKFYDTLGAVEYKLKRQDIRNAGSPGTASTPDHVHYRATYHQIGLTILYNSPFPDEDATIYAILLTNKKETGSL
jgi:hypothetical protein